MRDDYDRDDREKRRHRFPWWKKLLIKAGIYVALVLAAVIAILIGLYMTGGTDSSETKKQIAYSKFKDMVTAGYAQNFK